MKRRLLRILSIISLVMILLFTMAGIALAVDYYLYVKVSSEAGTSDYAPLALVADLNNQSLADLGYISESGLDTCVTYAGSELKHMVAEDKLTFVAPEVKGGVDYSYNYTMGNDPLTEFYIIPGYDGYVMVADDATLELGNNFEIEQKGWIDTATGSDKNLVWKDGAFRIYVNAAESIRAAIDTGISYPSVAAVNGGDNEPASTNHPVNLPAGIVSGDLLLVFFGASATTTITFPEGWTQLFQDLNTVEFGCWYRVADGGEGASITVTTSASVESAYTSYRITGYSGTPEAGTSATGTSVNPNPPSLTPSWGTKNTLWFAAFGCAWDNPASAYPTNYTDGRSDYAGSGVTVGSARRELNAASEDPGTFTTGLSKAWVANTVAIAPAVFYEDVFVTATGVSSGEHTIKVTADGTDLKIYVDTIEKDSAALGGVSVPDNTNDWTLTQNNVMPYMEYYKHTVGGTLIAWYQPNDMISGATLPDREGTAQNGTITWGSLPTGISTTIGSLKIVNLQKISKEKEEGAYLELFEEVPPEWEGMYSGEQYDVLPGSEAISELAAAGQIPIKLFWVPVIFGIAIFAGFALYSKTENIMAVAIAGGIVIGLFCAIGMLAWWVIIPYSIISVALCVSEKTYGF